MSTSGPSEDGPVGSPVPDEDGPDGRPAPDEDGPVGSPVPDEDGPVGPPTPSEDGPVGRPAPDEGAGRELTELEREILAFERKWWRHPGAKEQAIRDTFELSATRYYQLLNALLDEPAALAHEPVVVGRLRRLRASRGGTRR